MKGLGKKQECIIECDVYMVPSSYIEKLVEYNIYAEYEAYNSLLDYIKENYEIKRRQTNIFYYA